MPTVFECSKGALAALYLPAAPGQCWTLAYSAAELAEQRGQRYGARLTLELLAESVWSRWPRPLGPWFVNIPGEDFPAEVRRAVLTEAKGPAQLAWTWSEEDGERVALHGLHDATDAQARKLLEARRLIQDVRQQVGRPIGWRVIDHQAFREELANFVATRSKRITRKEVTSHFAIGNTTLKRYLDEIDVAWSDITRGNWPPRRS